MQLHDSYPTQEQSEYVRTVLESKKRELVMRIDTIHSWLNTEAYGETDGSRDYNKDRLVEKRNELTQKLAEIDQLLEN